VPHVAEGRRRAPGTGSQQVLDGLLAGKTIPLYERIFRKRDGAEFPVEMNVSLIRDDQGAPLYIQSIARDITRRKLEERLLRESEERYRSAIASLAEGVMLVDEDLIVRAANSSAKRILGRTLNQIVGEPVASLWGPSVVGEDGAPVSPDSLPVRRTFETATPHTDLLLGILRAGGERAWLSLNTQPMIYPGSKQPHAVVVSFFDITSRKQIELELAARNAELDAFSHTVAHDLKSPLQGIIGYANLLAEMITEDPTGELAETLGMIPRHAFKMSQIIDSLLLLAGLRDATVTLDPVDVQPVVEGALMRFQQPIQDRGIRVTVDPDLPPALAYGPWLEEVFANLIGNAVKYIGRDNPAPRISIHGYRCADVVRYEVEDNGLGIKPENRQRLFQMFARFHQGESKGHGLGLSIVQRIVTRLGGTLGVESEVGKGSTFWFALPRSDQSPGD
jgi:PAS domain S-box-containing protein